MPVGGGAFGEAWTMESNERYYRRRAVEERMAAQRAITEQARACCPIPSASILTLPMCAPGLSPSTC